MWITNNNLFVVYNVKLFYCSTKGLPLLSKRNAFALQKGCFCTPKG